MAFSKRLGAFSAAQKAREQADRLAGEWIDEDGDTLTIKGTCLTAADGSQTQLKVQSATSVSMEIEGKVYTGDLQSDDNTILWSDNCTWRRKAKVSVPAPAAAAPAAEASRASTASSSAQGQVPEVQQARNTPAAAAAAAADPDASVEMKGVESGSAGPASALPRPSSSNAPAAAAAGSGPVVFAMDRDDRAETSMDAVFEAAMVRSQANIARARQARQQRAAERSSDPAAAATPAETESADPAVAAAKARSEAGLEKARQAREAEKARKAAALERVQAEKAAAAAANAAANLTAPAAAAASGAAAAVPDAAPPPSAGNDVDEARARSEAGLEKARQAREAEKARKAAALERVRAQKAAAAAEGAAGPGAGAPGAEQKPAGASATGSSRASVPLPEDPVAAAKAKSEAGVDKARQAREAEKARKAAALERVRAEKAAAAAAAADEASAATATVTPGAASKPKAFSPPDRSSPAEVAPPPLPSAAVRSPTLEADLEDPPSMQDVVLEPGVVVRIQKLQNRMDLNGQIAQIMRLADDGNRLEVQILGMGSQGFNVKRENICLLTPEEFEKWSEEQGFGSAAAAAADVAADDDDDPLAAVGPSDLLCSTVAGPAMQQAASMEPGPLVRKPTGSGNSFHVSIPAMIKGSSMDEIVIAREMAETLLREGLCTVEAGADIQLLFSAHAEAKQLWQGGTFAPPMEGMGASELEELLWKGMLYQDEQAVVWISKQHALYAQMRALKLLSDSMTAVAQAMLPLLARKGVTWNASWDGMLACYHGNRTYAYHLDNPRGGGGDGGALPDNGLRLAMCYYINTEWSLEQGAAGGLDLFCEDGLKPDATASSLRQGKRARVAPHADTLVMFSPDRVAHQVVQTSDGEEPQFCLWFWLYDEAALEAFPEAAWQRFASSRAPQEAT
eukprot:CAMPEP_0178384924 /NCGR_PEP_ID=MMETSP0689_2-20121128/7768_1 /TAXON_ID=160604 /ORGANISM="Amphidinium massartii, Strain CS-259" /LENGTH=910 /DNA_ID=CAMNT_0020005191 /DNA_START=60 /DNA_END=2789 /DNA_ORIENTATION=-